MTGLSCISCHASSCVVYPRVAVASKSNEAIFSTPPVLWVVTWDLDESCISHRLNVTYNGSSFHLQTFPLLSHLHKHFAFILSFCPHLRFIKYLLFLGLACLFSGVCFQHWFGLCGGLTVPSQTRQCLAQRLGTEAWRGPEALSCAGSVGCSPVAGQTGPVNLTHYSHSHERHTQDRVWIV